MNTKRNFARLAALLTLTSGAAPAFAQTKTTAPPPRKSVKMVAYDAKDKKYYSVAWARAHRMRDRGGDKLIVIPLSKLPKGATMSRAMRGSR